ncbi:predicted protein [Naegleria gruberi]|uniref:non-specific serine/threonine protein kinase n=1 Tax=Naegleria gruberi TaxID=5762 RepID=D2W030_NAEGR|nr:uncharacterized protein NAEGRDRAFT_74710 [Naegleria gruberi]EFC37544.1 predicted protein [Naegleria gruberi]|eukprot:XP_002670288.1 predicted protein [Naegleria gruberi strain NEG-M]
MNDLLADCSSPPTILRSPLTGLFYWIKISGQPNQTKQVTVKCQVDNLNLLNVDRKDVDVLYFANIGIENVRIYDSYAKGFLLSNVKIVNLISDFTSLNLFILEYSNVYIFKFTTNSIQLSRIDNSKILYFTMNILIGTKQDKLYISNIQSTQSFIINTEQSSLLSLYNSIFEETLAFFSISFADNILIENCTFSVAMKSDPVFVIANTGLVRVWKSRMLNGGIWFSIRISTNVEFESCEISSSSSFSTLSYDTEFLITYQAPVSLFVVDTLRVMNSKFDSNKGERASTFYLSDILKFYIKESNFTRGLGSPIYIDSMAKETKLVVTLIENSLFQDNYSPNLGGAIFISTTQSLEISNTIFRNNTAKKSGGAIFILGATDLSLTGSLFYGNRVTYSNSLPTDKIYMGNGGAIFILSSLSVDSLSIKNATFESNYAYNGGALFYWKEALASIRDCTFRNNRAQRAGGAIYQFQKAETSLTNNRFIGNRADIFGDDYFLLENSLSLNSSNYGQFYYLYPGQQVFISAMATSSEMVIPVNVDNMYVNVTNPDYTFIVNPTFDGVNITMLSVEASIKKGLSTMFNITIGWAKYPLKESNSLTIQVVNCPTDTELVLTSIPAIGYSCIPKEKVSLGLILGIAIPSSILFFILGIISSTLVIYIVMKIRARLNKLSRKERAEKSIARKILDKRVIFGNAEDPLSTYYTTSLTSPLLSQNEMELKMKSRLEAIIINIEDLEIVKKISEGGQGVVYKAILFKETSVAVKSLKNLADDEELQLEFEKEASILASLQHANILKFYGVCITDETRYMVTEFLENGSLERLIFNCRNGKTNLTFQQKILLLQDIAAGMDYLHSLQPAIIHRDLKPGNVLLDEDLRCKICDFGLSRSVGNLTQNTMTRGIGTLFYASPELMRNEQELTNDSLEISHESKISRATKMDVYSFGIIMWELFFELTPYTVSSKVGANASLAPVNVLGMVLNGYRPLVPFETIEELQEWLNMYPVSNMNPVAILEYFILAKQCWNQQTDLRPSFSIIRSELLKILSTCNSRTTN